MKAKIAFIAAWMLCGINIAFAAPATDVTEQQQRAKQQEMEQQSRVDAPSVMTESEKTAKSKWELPVEPESMQVDTFIIDDEGKGFQWLKRELKEYRHQRVGADGLSMMLEKLNTRLKERGFITSRVVLPEQNISGKSVVFKVIPGYIEEIRFADNEKQGTWHSAFSCKSGDVLNVYDLDQGLEQMKRVPYQNVKMKLEPGTTAGKSKVILEVTREKPWSVGISWDDSGLESTGKHQGAVIFFAV